MAVAANPSKPTPVQLAFDGWFEESYVPAVERLPERKPTFVNSSGIEVKPVYTPDDVAGHDYLERLGFPGSYPYTRGPYPTMYRARPWTMRQIAGFGMAADTNQRFKFLIAQGQTGISCDFDMPTLMGYDSDDPRSAGEVGREGVAIDTLADVEELFDGIDLSSISVSMTINPTAWILLAMYVVAAEKRGIPKDKLSGTVQADILKEFIAQKEWIYPVRQSMRLCRDAIVYSVRHLPRYNPINVSGYHIREAGSTAVQELAFTLADGIAYVEEVLKQGIDVDDFAPRLAFYFVCDRNFFEEVAKFRAARRLWARIMKERFGARKPESMRLRFHCQTAGSSLVSREPLNNIARTAIQGLAAVLGGAQSLHTNGWDEALAIPSEHAMRIALRTQQIILEETGAADTIDGMAGSYYLESLTDRLEAEAQDYLDRIDAMGGTLGALEQDFFQLEIANSAWDVQRAKEQGDYVYVGVNKYRDPAADSEQPPATLHTVALDIEQRQIAKLQRVKSERDNQAVTKALTALREVARDPDANLMSPTIEAVRAYASGGEIVNALVEEWGRYIEHAVY
ncbi:MAG TPA: methylmalonyl-CoA mutase family protein [Chloroflexota bacterium]|nr:methylmalonyl-CoA mutase family protein [Chloroflexota bacterium]